MKKILCLILFIIILAAILFCCTGCNKQVFDFEYTFDTVHIYETGKCYKIKKIKKWKDFEDDQLQFVLEDDTVIVVHSTDCAMVKGTCPFCKK